MNYVASNGSEVMMITRRAFTGLLLAAPAIVQAKNIMPVRPMIWHGATEWQPPELDRLVGLYRVTGEEFPLTRLLDGSYVGTAPRSGTVDFFYDLTNGMRLTAGDKSICVRDSVSLTAHLPSPPFRIYS